MSKPFRWDITKREQLPSWVHGISEFDPYAEFVDDLQRCCSRILSFCDNADLIFVGRSPESIFDYLSGLFAETSWKDRLVLLNLSVRFWNIGQLQQEYPDALPNFRDQMSSAGLDPKGIISAPQPIAFVDLVSSGSTLGDLTTLLVDWAKTEKLDVPALRRKLRYVGIVERTKTSPNTWRWQQHVDWAKDFPTSVIKNVSVPYWLWTYLGNFQDKVSLTNPPSRWGDVILEKPPRQPENLRALRLAVYLYDLGRSAEHRDRFSRLLTDEVGMRHDWFRSFVVEFRRAG